MGSSMAHNSNIQTINLLYSGGAEGADTVFGQCAKKVNHTVCHYSFPNHKPNVKENIVVVNEEDLREANSHLENANKFLQRSWPTRSDYVDKLLQRNYWQVRDSKRIYAVASLDQTGHV